MRSPFPGMDPYLEHPSLWPDVHNSLIAAIRDALAEKVAPDYYIRLERRAYFLRPDDLEFIGRPDLGVISPGEPAPRILLPLAEAGVIEVEVPTRDEVGENFLEVHDTISGKLITVLELLSPVNKLGRGRQEYEEKRDYILRSRTNLVEVDLLRAGEPMPVSKRIQSDYRILVMRGSQRPRGQLYTFNLRQPIPSFSLPLLPGAAEPPVDLNVIVHQVYDRARFDLGLDYSQPPVPPLRAADVEWARDLIDKARPDRRG
jgi:hypothetical protein